MPGTTAVAIWSFRAGLLDTREAASAREHAAGASGPSVSVYRFPRFDAQDSADAHNGSVVSIDVRSCLRHGARVGPGFVRAGLD